MLRLCGRRPMEQAFFLTSFFPSFFLLKKKVYSILLLLLLLLLLVYTHVHVNIYKRLFSCLLHGPIALHRELTIRTRLPLGLVSRPCQRNIAYHPE